MTSSLVSLHYAVWHVRSVEAHANIKHNHFPLCHSIKQMTSVYLHMDEMGWKLLIMSFMLLMSDCRLKNKLQAPSQMRPTLVLVLSILLAAILTVSLADAQRKADVKVERSAGEPVEKLYDWLYERGVAEVRDPSWPVKVSFEHVC